MPDNYERFIRWYLRFNGYFTVENFYIHNPDRTWHDVVAAHTETDIIGVRMPYSAEVAGRVSIANHPPLVCGAGERFDVVIAEVKNADEPTPNSVWRYQKNRDAATLGPIEHIVRFIGLHPETSLPEVAGHLASHYTYKDDCCRIRYIMFSRTPNAFYNSKGVQHITFQEVVRFLDEQRGQCWRTCGLGVASVHNQWEPLINGAFRIFNGNDAPEARQRNVLGLLNQGDAATPCSASRPAVQMSPGE